RSPARLRALCGTPLSLRGTSSVLGKQSPVQCVPHPDSALTRSLVESCELHSHIALNQSKPTPDYSGRSHLVAIAQRRELRAPASLHTGADSRTTCRGGNGPAPHSVLV